MPNWPEIIRQQLQASGLSFSDSVVSELASHLQETYDALRARGLTHPAACREALREFRTGMFSPGKFIVQQQRKLL